MASTTSGLLSLFFVVFFSILFPGQSGYSDPLEARPRTSAETRFSRFREDRARKAAGTVYLSQGLARGEIHRRSGISRERRDGDGLPGSSGGVAYYPKKIIKVSQLGLTPAHLSLHHRDGSVFFYNGTQTELMSIEVDWNSRKAHCASANLTLTPEGKLTTISPVEPGDFAISCFPEAGAYHYKAAVGGKEFSGTVDVVLQ